jgi:hypothetical protein
VGDAVVDVVVVVDVEVVVVVVVGYRFSFFRERTKEFGACDEWMNWYALREDERSFESYAGRCDIGWCGGGIKEEN